MYVFCTFLFYPPFVTACDLVDYTPKRKGKQDILNEGNIEELEVDFVCRGKDA